jgi:LDH2 family malate/lactate/ureidoglycolate dehydrogenase
VSETRYSASELEDFATALLQWVDLPEERARVSARLLVIADMMGHTTYGLAGVTL